eukprot:2356509-Prorocentrum_lima.AAC.1
MTSSLVGSEMCIRDSGTNLITTDNIFASAYLQAIQVVGARYGLRSTSVSYTHLTLPTICSV